MAPHVLRGCNGSTEGSIRMSASRQNKFFGPIAEANDGTHGGLACPRPKTDLTESTGQNQPN